MREEPKTPEEVADAWAWGRMIANVTITSDDGLVTATVYERKKTPTGIVPARACVIFPKRVINRRFCSKYSHNLTTATSWARGEVGRWELAKINLALACMHRDGGPKEGREK